MIDNALDDALDEFTTMHCDVLLGKAHAWWPACILTYTSECHAFPESLVYAVKRLNLIPSPNSSETHA
jgi:hypothetical protein